MNCFTILRSRGWRTGIGRNGKKIDLVVEKIDLPQFNRELKNGQ